MTGSPTSSLAVPVARKGDGSVAGYSTRGQQWSVETPDREQPISPNCHRKVRVPAWLRLDIPYRGIGGFLFDCESILVQVQVGATCYIYDQLGDITKMVNAIQPLSPEATR